MLSQFFPLMFKPRHPIILLMDPHVCTLQWTNQTLALLFSQTVFELRSVQMVVKRTTLLVTTKSLHL